MQCVAVKIEKLQHTALVTGCSRSTVVWTSLKEVANHECFFENWVKPRLVKIVISLVSFWLLLRHLWLTLSDDVIELIDSVATRWRWRPVLWSIFIREFSVTSLDDFYKYLATNCLIEVAQIFWWFVGLFHLMALLWKSMWLLFGQFWWEIRQLFIPSSGHAVRELQNNSASSMFIFNL